MTSTFSTWGLSQKLGKVGGQKIWKKNDGIIYGRPLLKNLFLEQKMTEGIWSFFSFFFSFSLGGPNIARISRWLAMKLFFQHWVGDAIDPWWALFLPHCFHLCAKLHDQKSHQTQKFHHLTNAGIYQLHVTLCCFCLYSLEPVERKIKVNKIQIFFFNINTWTVFSKWNVN